MSSSNYDWQWRVQISLPCPIKTSGSNNGAWAGAASLFLSNQNFTGLDVSSFFRLMKEGDTVRVEHKTDTTIWSLWTLGVPPVDYGTCFTFPASKIETHGSPIDNTIYRVVLTSGVVQPTARLSVGEHMCNLSMIASGMLSNQNIPLASVGDDAIKVYTRLAESYLKTPELPQPVPPPAIPSTLSF